MYNPLWHTPDVQPCAPRVVPFFLDKYSAQCHQLKADKNLAERGIWISDRPAVRRGLVAYYQKSHEHCTWTSWPLNCTLPGSCASSARVETREELGNERGHDSEGENALFHDDSCGNSPRTWRHPENEDWLKKLRDDVENVPLRSPWVRPLLNTNTK